MSIVPPSAPQPHDPANPPPPVGADEFRLNVESFWEKNRSFLFAVVAIVLVAILAREGWQLYRAGVEREIQQAYAKIDRVDQLPKFVADHPDHALAGVAFLRLADDAYGKNDFKAAAAHYQKAADSLDTVALKSRARLGAAISQLAAGDRAAAETALKTLKDDAAALATLRAEAAFHLATLAREAGRLEEVNTLLDEVSKHEPMGLWGQRAFTLRAELATAAPAAKTDSASPAIQFKPGGE